MGIDARLLVEGFALLNCGPPSYKFIVTVIELECTNSTGGSPWHNTSRSLMYLTLSVSLSQVPSIGLGRVVKTTAVSSDCWRMSSFRIRCCARQGRSLKESGIAC
jgi:hypothetical protein